MKSQSKRLQIIIPTVTLIILAGVWALNGYDDTWLYITAAIISVPTSWFYLGKEGDNQ